MSTTQSAPSFVTQPLRDTGRPRLTPAPPAAELADQPKFPKQAKKMLKNTQQRQNLTFATTAIRKKRLLRVDEMPKWEEVREAASQIKMKMIEHMDYYLAMLETNLTKNGATVHWARDAEEANDIIVKLVAATATKEVVKVKSMVTQETDLNEALEDAGVAAWETDLAELIVQMGHDRPSHVLVPAIHRNRAEIREIFVEEMGKWGRPVPDGISSDPPELAGAARLHLREKFMRTKVSISGANFAIADTGTLCVVESEGNGRMCLTLPDTLISLVGIEKVLPSFNDIEVLMQLLPRSSTAEKMNPYTSMWSGVHEGDGPQNVHVVLIDNGRTKIIRDDYQRQALKCIRCSACMNICPVYERVGGHAYGSVYPGPIGSVITPMLRSFENAVGNSLPFACSLCGACTEVCPVKIDLADMLVDLRHQVNTADKGMIPSVWDIGMKVGGDMMGNHKHWEKAMKGTSVSHIMFGKKDTLGPIPMPGPASGWSRARDVPVPPKETFRDWWDKHERGEV